MNKEKIRANNVKRRFLLTFFSPEDKYEEREINGFWLIKSYDRKRDRWQVGIYTQESYFNYKGKTKKLI